MRKLTHIIIFSYYAVGMIFLPMGNFAFIHHLPEMYEQCKSEDPDMDLPDFVFEHFLNLEDIIARFEHEEEHEEHEKPHQPYSHAVAQSSCVVLAAKPFSWTPVQQVLSTNTIVTHLLSDDSDIPSAYLSGIFRPPISC